MVSVELSHPWYMMIKQTDRAESERKVKSWITRYPSI